MTSIILTVSLRLYHKADNRRNHSAHYSRAFTSDLMCLSRTSCALLNTFFFPEKLIDKIAARHAFTIIDWVSIDHL